MKDQKKDKFEAFIEDSLGGYEENPSDLLWENLETRIPKPPEESNHFRGWLFLFALLFLFGGGYWMKYTADIKDVNITLQNQEEKINSIAKEVAKINSNLENKLSPSMPTIKKEAEQLTPNLNKKLIPKNRNNKLAISNSISSNNVHSEKSNIFSTNKISTESITKYDTETTIADKTILNQKESQKTVSSKQTATPKDGILPPNTTTQNKMITKPLKELFINPLENIPSIFGAVISKNKKEASLNKIDLVDLIGKDDRKIGFEFYSFSGAIFPNINFELPVHIFKKQNSKNFSIGLLYNIHFNKKWSLQIGGEVTERTIGSNFDKSFEYGNIETLITNNQYRSKSSYQINTNYGKQIFISHLVNTKMNDGLDIEAGDYFNTNINVVRIQKYFAIPLFIKYNFSDSYKKLRWTAKAGIIDRVYFRENDIGEVTFQNISHPRLKHEYTIVENVGHGNTATRFGIELVLAAGMEYHFNKNWGIIIEPNFKKNVLERTTVNPYTIGIYSGLRWTFSK